MKYLLLLILLLTIHTAGFSQSDEIVTQRAKEYIIERMSYPETLEILSVKKVGILTYRNLIDKVILNSEDTNGKNEVQWDDLSYNIRVKLHEQLDSAEDAMEEPMIFCNRYKITFSAKNQFGKIATGEYHMTIATYPPYEKEMWYGRENVTLDHNVYELLFDEKIESLTK